MAGLAVAMEGKSVVIVRVRPCSTGVLVAVRARVPMPMIESATGGERAREVIPVSTRTVTVADFPSTRAVMFAVPGATPVMRPFELTVAAAAFDVDQLIGRPVIAALVASRMSAVASSVPVPKIESLGVDIEMVFTGGRTRKDFEPATDSLVAVIVVDPSPTLVTTPVTLSTVATAGPEEDHRIGRPVSTESALSKSIALAVAVPPIALMTESGLIDTATLSTGRSIRTTKV